MVHQDQRATLTDGIALAGTEGRGYSVVVWGCGKKGPELATAGKMLA